MNKIQQVKERAEVLYNKMEWLKPNEGKERVIITGDNQEEPYYKQLLDITFNVSENTRLSMDSVYRFTMLALERIAYSEAKNEDDIRDEGINIEGDIYTSDLTEWLNESNYHIYYLTECLEENEYKDGFGLLGAAQRIAKQEVFDCVLGQLLELV